MREHYDFSKGIRGKYAGKVDTADVRRLGSTKPVEPSPAAAVTNGNRGLDDRSLDGEIRHKRGDTLVGTCERPTDQILRPVSAAIRASTHYAGALAGSLCQSS
jgi:hypothetical protein